MGRIGGSSGGGDGEGGVGVGVSEAMFLEHASMVLNHAICSADEAFQTAAMELVKLDDRTGKLTATGLG